MNGMTSYTRDPEMARWARSRSIDDGIVAISEKLLNRLEKLVNVVDFSVIYLNKEVTRMHEGSQFGELALRSETDRRNATIKMVSESFLAYLDKYDYNMVMKRVVGRNTQRQLRVLKRNTFFQGVSAHRLQLFQLSVEADNPGG
jgi:hypothetical protein